MNPSPAPASRDDVSARQRAVWVATLSVQLLLLYLDAITPLGWSVWVFQLLALPLLLLQSNPWAPLAFGFTGVLGIALGYSLSPFLDDVRPVMAIANRSMGAASLLALAGVIALTLRQRAATASLLWVQQGKAVLSQAVALEGSPETVAERVLKALSEFTGASVAVLYRLESGQLLLSASRGADAGTLPASLSPDTGLIGPVLAGAAVHRVSPAPAGHLALRSALGHSTPAHLMLMPLRAEGSVQGVVELAFIEQDGQHLERVEDLCNRALELLGMALRTAVYRRERQAMLEESQRQAEELLSQQEELRANNEELESQGQQLRDAQAALEVEHLALERSHVQLVQQKAALEAAQAELELRADELSAASRYKSEFLANMSHELRTPLNSALILSRLLAENRTGSLSAEQVRYAQAIHDANNDLLALINDILDLAKVEAGHADLRPERVRVDEVVRRLRSTFEPLAQDKGLALDFTVAANTPAQFTTDHQRLQQVLKNLMANAVKFTRQGRVELAVGVTEAGWLRFAVTDTGIGIDPAQHAVIFEAFRQADGSTSRQFGGTGLGLSISRELVHRMGGTLTVCSALQKGSTFTVELPPELPADAAAERPAAATTVPRRAAGSSTPHQAAAEPVTAAVTPAGAAAAPAPADGSAHAAVDEVKDTRPVLLSVEDDPRFAAALREVIEDQGFRALMASTGEEALRLARQHPISGVLLDIGLPDQSGLAVLERLKRDPQTRHLPVHILSSMERQQVALEMGAVGFAVKPVAREALIEAIRALESKLRQPLRRVLVVEDDPALRDSLQALLSAPQVEIETAGSVAEALAALGRRTYDCMVTDLALPDGSGHDLLDRMAANDAIGFPPVIVYTGRALSRDEELALRRHSRSIIVKGARSPERLLDEVTLFLHSVEAQLPDDRRRMLAVARERDAVLEGRTILLAEDDVRNVFALTSVFEPHGVRLLIARNGQEALDAVERHPTIDLVLMDVMMPEMDGLAAMRRLRATPRGRGLPIIALTAKAMADDRAECLDAGANDYLAKPIDPQRLLSLCRVWMPK